MNRSRSPERQDRRNIADSRDAGREDSRRDRDGRGAPAGRDWDQRRDRDVGRDSGRSARDSGRDSRDSGRDSGRDARDSGRDAGRDARDSGRDPRDAGRDSGRDARDGREERSFRDSRDQIPREAREQNPRDLREQQKDSRDQRNPGSMTMDTGRGQEGSTANESEKSADTVYISGLPHTVTEESLTKFFATVGIIKPKVWLYKDKQTGVPKGDATVTFGDASACDGAISWFNGQSFEGSVLKVEKATVKAPPPGGWPVRGRSRGGFRGSSRY